MDLSDAHRLSELRIVLMGYREAGKSSAGNTILGQEEFDLKRSAQCVRRHGEAADTHITLIEAPGWWSNYTVEESPEILKQEIVLSVSLCPPGPHAVLLIIRVDTGFTETERKALQGHLDLLSERVWSHTIVLFTHGDSLSDTSIEQHIEREGQDLQRLLDKCGNRYHVLNNHNRSDRTQIKELLEKIEETVAQNNGRHFEIDRKILQEMEERRRAEEERAEERMKRMKKQRDDIRSQMSDAHHLSELRIVLMGYREAGKSSAGNTILGREEFDLKTSAQCVRRHGEAADTHITLIEAPGWWINEPVEESPEILKQEIVLSVSLCPPGPHAVLLIIRVDTGFKETKRKALQGHLDLLSERVWSHTIVLFTHGDSLSDTSIEQHIEREGQDLQRLLDKCGNRYHVLNNHNRSDRTQIKELLEKIEETVAQNNGRHFEIDRKILQEMEERRRAEEERAEERLDNWREDRSQTTSGADGSDSRSLGSSAHGSFRSRSGADSVSSSSRSRDSSDTSYETGAIKRHDSMEWLPPGMSGEERSDTRSLGSSGYGSFRSRSGADSVYSSSRSEVSSRSSGFGSLRSIPESGEHSGTRRALPFLTIPELFPRRVKKREDTEKRRVAGGVMDNERRLGSRPVSDLTEELRRTGGGFQRARCEHSRCVYLWCAWELTRERVQPPRVKTDEGKDIFVFLRLYLRDSTETRHRDRTTLYLSICLSTSSWASTHQVPKHPLNRDHIPETLQKLLPHYPCSSSWIYPLLNHHIPLCILSSLESHGFTSHLTAGPSHRSCTNLKHG